MKTKTKANTCIHCGEPCAREECTKCRSGFYYWNRKTPTERLKRRNQLDVLSSRLDTHFNTRGKPNDEPLRQPGPKTDGSNVIVMRAVLHRSGGGGVTRPGSIGRANERR